MNCKDLQPILLDTPNTEEPAAREHLRTCADCRRFAAFHDQLLTTAPAVPPPELDQAILGAAKLRLARRRRRRFQHRLLAMAAAVAVLFGWLAVVRPARDQPAKRLATIASSNPKPAESIWADGKLEAALQGIEEQATLLSMPLGAEPGESEVPSLHELDSDLLEFELDFYFERAVLTSVEPRANG